MKLEAIIKLKQKVDYLFANKKVYVYGAGKFATVFLEWINEMGHNPEKILVSKKNSTSVSGMEVDEYVPRKIYNGVLIIALNSKYHMEILDDVKNSFELVFCMPDELFRDLLSIREMKIRNSNDVEHIDKKISYCLEIFQTKKVVMFQRYGGIGDTLIIEPICRKLKKMNHEIRIIISTYYEMLFDYSDSVDFITNDSPGQFFQENIIFISLNYLYEIHPFRHILDSYLDAVTQFFPDVSLDASERIPIYDNNIRFENKRNVKSVCINTEASGWKSRLYDRKKMKLFVRYLKNRGYTIYEIGSNPDNYLGVGENCFDLSFHETVSLMSRTDMYIGLDNGLMHLAQSIKLPIFVLFGCVCPLYRIHDWSRARVMWKNVDELTCAGCYHRRQIPCSEPVCIHDNCYCMEWSVDEVIYAFENYKYNSPPQIDKKMLIPLW